MGNPAGGFYYNGFMDLETYQYLDGETLKNKIRSLPRGALDEQLEKNRKANFAYGNYQIDTYRKYSGSVPQIEKQAAELWEQVFAVNQPRPHGYEIRRQ